MNARALCRRLGLGRLLYRTWHAPRSATRRLLRRGILRTLAARRGRRAMVKALRTLPPLPAHSGAAPAAAEVHLLTGSRFHDMTAWCAWSLRRHLGCPIRIVLWDDGTLGPGEVDILRGALGEEPAIVSEREAGERLDAFLPASRFPALRERRLSYPNLRKLVDIHAGGEGARLVLDSDILFFRRPDALAAWLRDPADVLVMRDAMTSYGHPSDFLAQLCGRQLPEQVNVGVTGLRSEAIDWDLLEHWLARLHERGRSYLDEQALIAMLCATRPHRILPDDGYVCMPRWEEIANPAAAMHHYVDDSRPDMYITGWRSCLAMAGGGAALHG